MAFKAPKGNGGNKERVEQPNIEPGGYPGRLVQLIDLGLQPQKPYQGQEKAPVQMVMFTYELVDCFMLDEEGNEVEDKPRWISETLPFLSLKADKAKSTQRYKAFDPNFENDGDWSKYLGEPVTVTIINNPGKEGKVYDNIASLSTMRARDADKCPPLKNPAKMFSLDEPNIEVFNSLPEWIRDKIKSNLNYKGSKLEKLLQGSVSKAPNKAKEASKPVEEEEAPWEDNTASEADSNDDTPY